MPHVVRAFALALTIAPNASATTETAAEPIRYDRDVRGLLANACLVCHGPDPGSRKADLRLDLRDDVLRQRGRRTPIVPFDAAASELVRRIRSTDPDVVMPPPSTKRTLTAEQIATLTRWIEEGAEYREHWAFTPPRAPPVPAVGDEVSENPVDAFVDARLAEEGLAPLPEADRPTLIRRVTLDLTGLPPTPEEVDAFVRDRDPDAYERVVDRLLASPRYAEQMARHWLDAARYADTHGLHLDNRRVMWKYRDWVVDAFDRNLPFDRFGIEQLAGDLIEDASLEQQVASGFNRCNVTTSEGGAIDEEYLVKYAVDRVETVSTVFMGLTMGCAACHDHKYDPLSQREFYGLFAYFNNTAEAAMDGNADAPPPVLRVPDAEQRAALDRLEEQRAELVAALERDDPAVDAAQTEWEAARRAALAGTFVALPPATYRSREGARLGRLDDGSLVAVGPNPARDLYEVTLPLPAGTSLTALRLEALADDGLPAAGPGRSPNGNVVLTEVEVAVEEDGAEARSVAIARVTADHSQPDFPVAETIDGDFGDDNGWGLLKDRRAGPREAVFAFAAPVEATADAHLRVTLHFGSKYVQHALGRFRLSGLRGAAAAPTTLSTWSSAGPIAAATREAARDLDPAPRGEWTERPEWSAEGVVHRFADGEIQAFDLRRTLHAPTARRMTVTLGSDDALRVFLNGALVHDNFVARGAAPDQDRVELDLVSGENELRLRIVNFGGASGFAFRVVDEALVDEPFAVAAALLVPPDARADEQRRRLRERFRRAVWPEGVRLAAEAAEVTATRETMRQGLPTTLVSRERTERRQAYLLERGEYDRPGEPVDPGVPAALPPLPDGARADRLGFAEWLFDPGHPLTARVTVNRLWQQLFGVGLVKTSEDFGTQGALPSHPALLDWLATRFVEDGWDVRRMMRLLATSRAYRRSSHAPPPLRRQDPDNRWLARGPRLRLDAEVLRDQALAASGLLVDTIGGPPVRPYQPGGIWNAVGYTSSNTANYTEDRDEGLWRRSLYTFWKRTAPPPAMAAFDAPSRETCTVRRERTNTPLAALVMMNDVQFVEAARRLAARALREADDDDARVERAFRLLLARSPDDVERVELRAALAEGRARFGDAPADAAAFLAVGEAPRDESLDAVEHASFTWLCCLLLNLDETITKG